MDSNELRALLPEVVAIASQAGEAILEIYDAGFDVMTKEDNSPLTQADLAAHGRIVEGLDDLEPRLPILSEEAADTPWDTRRTWPAYWLVDPLDGTKEFIKRNGEFTVNIALIADRVPVLGVVHVPVQGVSYLAAAGNGCWKEDAGELTPLKVSAPATPVRVVGSRSHASPRLQAYLEAMTAELGGHELVSMGSSLKLCLVAEGAADLYPRLGPTSEWDTAAAQCVVEQAGGQVTDTSMRRLLYNRGESYLNPEFFVFADQQRDWSAWLPADE